MVCWPVDGNLAIRFDSITRLPALGQLNTYCSRTIIAYKLNKLWSVQPKDAKEFRKKEAKAFQGLFKNGTDLVIPSARLGWINVSDGIVGLAGTITSGRSSQKSSISNSKTSL
jgi:hypothetical protein